MRSYKQLLLANKAWSTEHVEEKADYFAQQVKGQRPEILWIGSSDSRVSPEQMTNSPPGSMVIYRNIANLVRPDDLSLLSVLQYAVERLGVKHVIVCGHHGCAGVKAALSDGASGPMGEWLAGCRDVLSDHAAEIEGLPTEEAKVNRLVEYNVRQQLLNLARTDTVRTAFADGRPLALHGWVYDIRDGLLKPLMEIDADTVLDTVGSPEPVLV